VKDAWSYVERSRLGGRNGRGAQGASYYAAPNPTFGAVFTYYLAEKLTTRKERRQKREKKSKSGAPYPTYEELSAEDTEKEPQVLFLVRDDTGAIVQRVRGKRGKGLHRVAWNLRYPSSRPTRLTPERRDWGRDPVGPLALPGTYTVEMVKVADGATTSLAGPERFNVVPLELATFPAKDKAAVLAFRRRAASLQRAAAGAARVLGEVQGRLNHLRKAALDTPGATPETLVALRALQARLHAIRIELNGNSTLRRRETPSPLSIRERVDEIVDDQSHATSAPTATQHTVLEQTGPLFAKALADLRALVNDLAALEAGLEAAGAPWTPGRLPEWK